MKITKNKNIISEKLSDSTFILNNETGVYIELNETASFLWNSFENTSSSKDLIEILMSNYEVEYDKAEDDINSFTKECISSKLIKIVNS